MKTTNALEIEKLGIEKFLAGYNCAQSVLQAFAASLGLERDTALKVACGLG